MISPPADDPQLQSVSSAQAHGAFDRETARARVVQGRWRLDLGLVAGLRRYLAGRSLFDFGAGIGLYCKALNCRGVDGIPDVETLSEGLVARGDLADPELVIPPHEVALCLEVAEHIPRDAEPMFLNNLTRECHSLVLSWATPGQPGHGHINCREWSEVNDLLLNRGFHFSPEETARLRRSARLSWFRRNVTVFDRL